VVVPLQDELRIMPSMAAAKYNGLIMNSA